LTGLELQPNGELGRRSMGLMSIERRSITASILDQISVVNKFIENQTQPSLQSLGVDQDAQDKLAKSLKGKHEKSTGAKPNKRSNFFALDFQS